MDYKIETGIPVKERSSIKYTGMTKIAKEMPLGGSVLFMTEREAYSCANALRQIGFAATRRKRYFDKDGEEGWRVWNISRIAK